MIRPNRLIAAAGAIAAFAVAGAPASAQYANEYSPPKLLRQGTTSKAIAGAGRVVVQVQVNADGTHKATRVLSSSNSADNSAAMEIAQTSSYSPAHRGKKPVTAFYDFTLHFTGSSVAGGGGVTASSMGGAKGEIDRLLRAGSYTAAMNKAQQALSSSPNDQVLNAELGSAQFFLNDDVAAAASFDKAPNMPKEFANVAAQAYQLAAAKLSTSNPSAATQYGQKAVAMAPGAGSYYALGSAELESGNTDQAIADLKKSRDLANSDPHSGVKARISIDSELMNAYLKAGDNANATTIANEIKRLDPNSDAAQTIMGNEYMVKGNNESKAGDHQSARSDYEKAAQVGGQKLAVTAYAGAALEESRLDKPDYTVMKADADKALAIDANDPLALYAEGVALYGQYITGGSTNAGLKQQALDTLNKAKSAAQSAGNASLVSTITSFMSQNIK
ncbi:MAG TPA: TonB family protein [Candidatus Baltobacteraceae bacterium]|jgi:TonB family protein|nr:TonB family protein [Candidatus Baltobacteraceae bacterium]